MTRPLTAGSIIGLSSAIAAIILALASGYLALDRRVTSLAIGAINQTNVEHIIDLKTGIKLDEILRRLVRIEDQLERRHQELVAESGKPTK